MKQAVVTREVMRLTDMFLPQISVLRVATLFCIFFPLGAGSNTKFSSPVTCPTLTQEVTGFRVVPIRSQC